MPVEDSEGLETQSEPAPQPVSQSAAAEEIVTPIEAEIQDRVEREFEKPSQKKAIVSVNGEDVGESSIANHGRAA
jgi:hypothetical protein